jgi:two-component system cell cycle sensor histidine kinase PleC
MLVVNVGVVLAAGATTYLAVLRWQLLSRARAQRGVVLINGGFWIMAALHLYSLFAIIALPSLVGAEAAEARLNMIHMHYGWYFYPAGLAFIVAGLAITSRRLEILDSILQAAKAEAEVQSAQKSAFLASMSHELRTPLNAILGYSEFMQLDPIADKPDRMKDYAASIHSSGRMLHDLISDLLDLSRIEQGRLDLHLEEVDLGNLVRDCIGKVEGMGLRRGSDIAIAVGADDTVFILDRRAIEQVTLNLVTNAAKHTPRDAAISVAIDRKHDGGAQLVVSDRGSGIPREILDNIFDPYVCGDPFTSEGERGYGLGMSICKRLIDAHGGSITVESELGQGTVVTVTLPKIPGPPPRVRTAA